MTVWTVECGCAVYDFTRVTVEADTLDAALAKAIEAAGDSSEWTSRDQCGPIHVDAAAPGADAEPWRDFRSVLPIPPAFTEDGEPPFVAVDMDGGLIHDVHIDGRPVRILVRDYDVEGVDPDQLEQDADGAWFAASRWGAWPDDPPGPDPEIPTADPGGG